MKTSKILALTIVFVFFIAGFASALPFNDRDPQIVPGATSGPDNGTLQDVLDNVLPGEGFLAVGDQNSAALWQSSDQSTSAFAVSLFAPWNGILGVYSASNGTMIPLLNVNAPTPHDDGGVGAGSDYQKEFYMNGDKLSFDSTFLDSSVTYNGFGSTFGFYYERTDTHAISYSEDSENGGDAKALVYFLPEGTMVDRNAYINSSLIPTSVRGNDDWLIAFEAGSDNDFQDAVFLLEDMRPVPEPATILLFGAGLLGLAAYGRKKGFRRG